MTINGNHKNNIINRRTIHLNRGRCNRFDYFGKYHKGDGEEVMEQNKLEEALKTIKEWKETCEKFPDEKMASKHYKWIASIHKVAIECIDKQIPKKTKVEAIEERIFINYCPSCGNEVVGGIRYCADCGQRLEYQWKEKKPSSI